MGSVSCPCIDASAILTATAALAAGAGSTSFSTTVQSSSCSADELVYSAGGFLQGSACYPKTYGSLSCNAHDSGLEPFCESGPSPSPAFCLQPWCYVDASRCKLSEHAMFLSDYFAGAKLYYSYSTCGGSADDWERFKTTSVLDGQYIVATVPGLEYPAHFKRPTGGGSGNEIGAYAGDEYYDASIAWQGVLPDYLDAVAKASTMQGFKCVCSSQCWQSNCIDGTWLI